MSDTDLADEPLRLASADNFRDVAGPGYPTDDGGNVKSGAFYRSNELQLTPADVDALRDLGLSAIFDLRQAHEVQAHPDAVVPGAAWRHLEVGGIPMDRVSSLADRHEALEQMLAVYRVFVEHPEARASFGALLTGLADAPGPALFHCTAGKDRTGWAAALLLHLAGVADDVILADYLASNDAGGTREKYLTLIRENLGEEKVPVYEAVMVVDAAYLRAGYDAVTAAYGDRAAYLREGLGLSEDTLARLRAKLRG